jgi:hypothetical protein
VYACVVPRWLLVAGVLGAACIIVPASAQTMQERIQALEAKTGFYTSSTKKLSLSYRKGQPTGNCVAPKLNFMLEPAFSLAGTSHAWLAVTLNYRRVPGTGVTMNVEWTPQGGPPASTCTMGTELSGPTGTYSSEGYCRFDVEPGTKVSVAIRAESSDDGVFDICPYIGSAKLALKLVNIGIHKPD